MSRAQAARNTNTTNAPPSEARAADHASTATTSSVSASSLDRIPLIGMICPDTDVDTVPYEDGANIPCTSKQWLARFGLKARKLDVHSIVRRIGFRHMKGHLHVLAYIRLLQDSRVFWMFNLTPFRYITMRSSLLLIVDYDFRLRKEIRATYGDSLFARFIEEDGTEYNVSHSFCYYVL